MSISYDTALGNLQSVINSNLPLEESWGKIIDFYSDLLPADYWNTLKQINVGVDQADLTAWMERLVTESPLPRDIIAIWIGIVKILDCDDNGIDKEVYAIYLTGSDKYDSEDADWAVNPIYDPENRYIIPDVLNLTDEIIKNDLENYAFLDYILPLAYCALAITDIIKGRVNKNYFLKHQKSIFVSVGFDNGDWINLAPIN
ncbi:hypothetical protein ACFFGT_20810 [Mucilaginibacter angelicae]|uniref:DUF2313 domain-containing protein n=1 Tax=Mucilaginibacter angelicae TaxID=869718 RepID=A0ABV6LB58_9SPHI